MLSPPPPPPPHQDAVEEIPSAEVAEDTSGDVAVFEALSRPRRPRNRRDLEAWTETWEDELLNLWHMVQDHCSRLGLPFFDEATYPDFVDTVYLHSSRPPSRR